MDNKYRLLSLNKSSAFPLANQLAQKLTWMIASEIITEGETLPDIRTMGDFLGLHMHTIRAAYHLLEQHKMVTVKPRAGTVVQKYVPFLSQLEPDIRHNGLIAVLIPEMSAFYNQIFKGIQSVAEPEHFLPLAVSCGEDPYRAESIYADISAGGFVGVINISVGFPDTFYVDFHGDSFLNLPLVFVDDFNATTHRVLINTANAIQQATRHMLEHGYQNIVLLNCPLDWPIGFEVYQGYAAALQNASLTPSPDRVYTVPDFTHSAGVFTANRILQSSPLPRAIVCAGDELALGAITAIHANGLSVPQDIAIIGYNDIPISTSSRPGLSTIALPALEIGAQAARSLLKIINKETRTWESHAFSGKLVLRESCGCINK